jgi:oxygen-dependent protoporphyrinogen oxidase
MMLAVPSRILPFLRSGLFSWPGKLRMGLDLVRPRRREHADESIASFLRRRFGQESVDLLGEPLLAGIHAGDPERLSIRATFPRFADLEARHGSLIRGLWSSPRPAPQPGSSAFYSLAGGLEEMVPALVSRLPEGSLSLESTVRSLSRHPAGFRLEVEAGALRRRVPASPAPRPRASSGLDGRRRTLRGSFAPSATVLLGYRRDQVAHPSTATASWCPGREAAHRNVRFFSASSGRAREPRPLWLLGGPATPACWTWTTPRWPAS